jgi:putative hydrolase of the HAD superfamily
MDILIDIGRVLLDFEYEGSLERLLPSDTPDREARLAKLLDRKDEFEAGRIDVETYVDWALGVLESDATADEFCDAWRQIFTPNEPMWRCVKRLAAEGHRLILFSNINGIHVPWIYDEFPGFRLFHGAVLSFHTGFIKPQAEIYEYAVREYGLDPQQTLYIDDLAQNVEAGRAFGFATWQYDLNDHAAFEAWLDRSLSSEISTHP